MPHTEDVLLTSIAETVRTGSPRRFWQEFMALFFAHIPFFLLLYLPCLFGQLSKKRLQHGRLWSSPWPADTKSIKASLKAYLVCTTFTTFSDNFLKYDMGWMEDVLAMLFFIHQHASVTSTATSSATYHFRCPHRVHGAVLTLCTELKI